jgi:acetolactate synthase small subunit
MKQEFTLEIAADNNFSILNRIVNILNRRRVRIKKLIAHEIEGDFYRGGAILLLYTTSDIMEKVKHQLEKLIEVEYANYIEGSDAYYERSEKHGCRVPSSSRAMTA